MQCVCIPLRIERVLSISVVSVCVCVCVCVCFIEKDIDCSSIDTIFRQAFIVNLEDLPYAVAASYTGQRFVG